MEINIGQEHRAPKAAYLYLLYILGFCVIFSFRGKEFSSRKVNKQKE